MLLELIEIIGVFVLPASLMYFKVLPFKRLKHAIVAVPVAVLLIILLERWPLAKLGIRIDNITTQAITLYTLGTIIGLAGLLIIARTLGQERQPDGFFKKKFFLYEFLIISFIQEFMYRGFLIPKLQAVFSSVIAIIIVNAALFTLLHAIYENKPLSLLAVFIAGVYFATMYSFHPNLILITLSHAVLNYVAVLYNFYRDERRHVMRTGVNVPT